MTAVKPSLAEVNGSVPVAGGPGWRRVFSFAGPGYLVAVGYMDPGNWATDIIGGSAFGYQLLSVILIASLLAVFLQSLAAKLGIIGGLDLAQACRARFSRRTNIVLWILCEIAIVACDLAELIGTAIALQLLFGLSIVTGVVLTSFDVLLILVLQRYGFRYLEAFVIATMIVVVGCLLSVNLWADPDLATMAAGFVPSDLIITDPAMLLIAMGILGATVMPHNLYLHSSIVQTRAVIPTLTEKRRAWRYATLDSTIALALAFFVNASILTLAAAFLNANGFTGIAEIPRAHEIIGITLGFGVAATCFAVALLLAGQNSAVTATLAGQIVMEGFLDLRLSPVVRRIITRLVALIPAIWAVFAFGDEALATLLVISQVVLSMQLPFAVIPLVATTSDRQVMGGDANGPVVQVVAYALSAALVALNGVLLWHLFG